MKPKKSPTRILAFEPLEARLAFSSLFYDFSTDPGIETNNPERYKVSNGALEVDTYTNSQEYATLPFDYHGEDFTLAFDIKVLDRSTGDTNIGLFSDARKTNQPSPGDPTVYIFYGGYEQSLALRGYDAKGNYFQGEGKAPSFEIGKIYHTTLSYNAGTKEVTLQVSSEEDSNYQTPYVSKALLQEQIPALSHLGVSSVGNWATSNRFQKVAIDNVFFETINKNPKEPMDVNNDGIVSPMDALVLVNALNAGTTNPQTSPPFLDVNGDRYVTPLDLLKVINYFNRYSAEGESSKLSQKISCSVYQPSLPTLKPALVDEVLEDFSFLDSLKKRKVSG